MTSLEDRPRTALLVIDVQNGVVGNACERDRVIANIQALVGKARARGCGPGRGPSQVRRSKRWMTGSPGLALL